MSFGRNPHVAKAEAAEQKAQSAKDDLAREQAFREAARLWERASERETDDKRKQVYVEKAELARAIADGQPAPAETNGHTAGGALSKPSSTTKKPLLN